MKDSGRTDGQETLNELPNKEAKKLTSAAKYKRTESRQENCSGHYSRKPTVTSGEVLPEIQKLKEIPLETVIIGLSPP